MRAFPQNRLITRFDCNMPRMDLYGACICICVFVVDIWAREDMNFKEGFSSTYLNANNCRAEPT